MLPQILATLTLWVCEQARASTTISLFQYQPLSEPSRFHFTPENLWPDAIVPYQLDKALVSKPRRRRLIEDVMALIQNMTCIRFVSLQTPDDFEGPFLYLTLGDRCSSYVGRQPELRRQVLTLTKSCMSARGVTHELVHALGFGHEHTRLDRDQYVDIDFSNIQSEFAYTFQKEADGHQLLGYAIPYDFDSVMHYGPHDFANDLQKTVIKSKVDPFYVRSNSGLSFLDIYKLNWLYQCKRELNIISVLCLDYFAECFWIRRTGEECKTEYVRRVCRKKCGLCA